MAIPQLAQYRYSPNYQGIPLQEARESLAMGAKDWHDNLDTYNKLAAFKATLRSLPGDQEYVQAKLDAADQSLRSMSKQVQSSQRWDTAGSAIQQMSMAVTADPKILAASESYANFLKGEEVKQAMRIKGDVPLEFNDPTKHRSFDEKGNIQIFTPRIDAKADYVDAAAKLWNTLAPELLSANLSKSDVDGILEGRTVKGITPDMVRNKLDLVENTYKGSSQGTQQKEWAEHTGSKTADKDIRSFLLGVGMLKTHVDADVKYTNDPGYLEDQRYKRAIDKATIDAASRLAVKKSKGRPDYDATTDGWFSRRVTEAQKGVSGKDKVIIIGIDNKNLIDGLSETLSTPQKDMYEFAGTDTKGVKKDDVSFVGQPRVVGIISTNAHGEDYRGGFYANANYRVGDNGKLKTATIVMKNTNQAMRSRVETLASIEDAIAKPKRPEDKRGLTGYAVRDTSGYLDGAQDILAQKAKLAGGIFNAEFGFMVQPNGDKKTGYVVPVIYKNGEKNPTPLNPEQLAELGLHKEYSIDSIYGMANDKLAKDFSIYAQTNSSLQKQAPAPELEQ